VSAAASKKIQMDVRVYPFSAQRIGKLIAERASKAKVDTVVFDRGAYLFHGRVKALADAAREAGLKF